MSRTNRWLLIAALVVVMALCAVVFGWDGYVLAWIGGLAKMLSAGCIGWAVSRYVLGLDLSAITDQRDRTVAALSQAIIIGACMIAGARAV